MIAQHRPPPAIALRALIAEPSAKARLRLLSLGWALLAAAAALLLGALLHLPGDRALAQLLPALLRPAGCGFFYGLLAFHLQRVDPDDRHLQAGLVGAVCGIHSLALPLPPLPPAGEAFTAALQQSLPAVMMVMIRAWLPIAGGALVLHGALRLTPSLRP